MQQQHNNNKKNILIAVVIIVLILAGYFIFFNGPSASDQAPLVALSPDGTVLGPNGTGGTNDVGGDILPLIREISTIKIEPTILNNPTFDALMDFSVQLSPEPIGRDNPFSPFGYTAPVVPAKAPTKKR